MAIRTKKKKECNRAGLTEKKKKNMIIEKDSCSSRSSSEQVSDMSSSCRDRQKTKKIDLGLNVCWASLVNNVVGLLSFLIK